MIKIEGLRKRFGEFTAVDGLNFDIKTNEIFGLLGPNGAGKTTTINMICGLLPLTEGKITFENHQGKDLKSFLGYCPQENIFYPKLTCLEQFQNLRRFGVSAITPGNDCVYRKPHPPMNSRHAPARCRVA